MARFSTSVKEIVQYKGIGTDVLEARRAIKRVVRWIGCNAVPHVNIEPAQQGDTVLILTDGVENIIDWHLRQPGTLDTNWEKLVLAVESVARGEVNHFLEAIPSFWSDYSPGDSLGDDATALVIYEG